MWSTANLKNIVAWEDFFSASFNLDYFCFKCRCNLMSIKIDFQFLTIILMHVNICKLTKLNWLYGVNLNCIMWCIILLKEWKILFGLFVSCIYEKLKNRSRSSKLFKKYWIRVKISLFKKSLNQETASFLIQFHLPDMMKL